ncbi:DNA-directed DNA polymerase II small subunit [Halobellus rufus]|uniref:DNA-directed DNA polymerase II small subunit n=1 Tax=Halobellus rufus TaxID=1448860 RepID=UPI000678DA1D|nr:DNA-directed DNA polymerase II small subunit [Halobellus rufus]
MPLETPVRIVQELTARGYNAEQEAVTLIAGTDAPGRALDTVVEFVDDEALRITAADVRSALAESPPDVTGADSGTASVDDERDLPKQPDPLVSTGDDASSAGKNGEVSDRDSPVEAKGSGGGDSTERNNASRSVAPSETDATPQPETTTEPDATTQPETTASSETGSQTKPTTESGGRDPSLRSLEVSGDVTGQSTGTGEYGDFVKVFRDRYEKLSKQLRGRVNHRPATAIQSMSGGADAAMVGLVNDIRSTKSGHWLVELEDTTGTFPCLVMKDREFAGLVDELLLDECIAVEGTLSDDAGIMFVDSMHFPDVPRTYTPNTADRHVQAALVSDVHVGSQEFVADAWGRFADWLHTEEAEPVEYLLIAGDMVEGVGVYPNQDEELDIVDIYEQYETFSEHLKDVPGDIEILMIPGNHDAVRLAEPQPGFDENLRDIMSAHDARITGNPSLVTVEGVKVLMYHGVSLDEVIAELPADKASYDDPHKAMYQLLKKRHVAPQFGGKTRLAPEEKDYLVMEEVPDVFHTGHVHKLGWGKYHDVLAVNSGCWQAQTDFQKSVNIDPDVGYAPILDLDTLDMTVRKFV